MADRFVWTAADGTVVDLTDESAGLSVLANGTRGLRSVEYAFTTAEYANTDGVQVQAVKASANAPTLGLILQANSEASFIARSRALVRAMRPKAGPGTLTVSRADGSSRSLTCYVTAGMEGDEAVDTTLPGSWWKFAIKLMAPDPWWRGTPRTIDTGIGTAPDFFPIFPMRLAASTVAGSFSVDLSDADAPSYPRWTITGPGSSLTLTNTWNAFNAETGALETKTASIVVNAPLLTGESMVIDTRPGFQSVRKGDGTNLMGSLATDPALWPLVETVNDVSALMPGTTAASRIVGTYEPKYAGI